MHNAGFATMGMNWVYVPMEVTNIKQGVTGLMALGFKGVSVTVPHKETVIQYLDEIDPVAEKIGAVNTLLFHKNSKGKITVNITMNVNKKLTIELMSTTLCIMTIEA